MKKFTLLFLLIIGVSVGSGCNVVDSISEKEAADALFPVLLNGEWGYINRDGAMVIEPRFQIAYAFSDGLAAVREDWRWKYIDDEGEDTFEGAFQEVRPYYEGKAAVRVDGRWGYVNTNGRFVINPRFREAHPFSGDRAFVRTIDYRDYQYVDGNGNKIESLTMPDEFDFIEDNRFENNRALVRDGNQYGYIDASGNTAIDLKYSEAQGFSDKMAAVMVSDRWGYIDTNGELDISPQFISAGKFKDGLAPARKSSNNFGYINTSGTFVISEQFEFAEAFSEERAAVSVNGKWTFIDKTGAVITNELFDAVEPFEHGLARVIQFTLNEENEVEELYGYINKEGKFVWYPTQ